MEKLVDRKINMIYIIKMIDSNINYIKYLTIAIFAIYLICNKSFAQTISGPDKPTAPYGRIYNMNEHPAFAKLDILNAKRSSQERLNTLIQRRNELFNRPMTERSKIALDKLQTEIYLNNRYYQSLSQREYLLIKRNMQKAY